jgi:spore germination protein GerM
MNNRLVSFIIIALIIGMLIIGVLTLIRPSSPPGISEITPTPPPDTGTSQELPQTISVFFSPAESIDCTQVVAVDRQVPYSLNIAEAALNELLTGPRLAERNQNLTSAIPVDTTLNSLVIENGVARADFSQNLEPGGGSCRVLAIRSQIEQTLRQFPTVSEVVISIDGKTDEILEP